MTERIERQEAEDAIEQERRNDLIRQIAIEPVPKLKAKVCFSYFFSFVFVVVSTKKISLLESRCFLPS